MLAREITGYDDHILARALYEALKYQERLPEWLQSKADADDMRTLLAAHFPDHELTRRAFDDAGLELAERKRAAGTLSADALRRLLDHHTAPAPAHPTDASARGPTG